MCIAFKILSNFRFCFCILDWFAFSYKPFVKPGQHTPFFRSALDAFNIFDLFVEVWKNVRWLFLAVILRRTYIRNPEHETFNIYDAFNGKRNVSVYGRQDEYSKLDRRGDDERGRASEAEVPLTLLPGKKEDAQAGEEQEFSDRIPQYSNTYGEKS